MAEAQFLVQRLLATQNSDGGWSYLKGPSWTEPTALALLALQSERDIQESPLGRGVSWLLSQQRPSGGWPPNPAVAECTSVTSLATLALLPSAPSALERAMTWTAGQVYRDHLSPSMILAKTLHLPLPHAPGSVPWFPGAAGWVMPTSLAILALSRCAREKNQPNLRTLALQSCSYLLTRRCIDNGWNHGGSKTRSEDATSYPETTGLALLALRAAGVPRPPASISLAKQFAQNPHSLEGLSWIQMALHSSSNAVPDPQCVPAARTNRDTALRLITLSTMQGSNILLGDRS